MMRGRTARAGGSAAALRLRAYQRKMAMRQEAARLAAAASGAFVGSEKPASTIPWVPLGPAPLISDRNLFGPVAGRTTAIAIDPTDATGNTVYIAAASGGVWKSLNAANSSAANVTWTALTDQQESLVTGAVSVKPDGSVVLAGTGEPNSASDSYYGVGVLRSTDHGASWKLIGSADGGANSFAGLGFAKFTWDTAISGTVVAVTGTTSKGVLRGRHGKFGESGSVRFERQRADVGISGAAG